MSTDASRDRKIPGTRTKARKRALDILFEADLRGSDALSALAGHVERDQPPVRPFTMQLVEGVVAEQASIDQVIAASLSRDWTLARMPRVDRCLARIAVFEMWFTGLEPEIAVSEAVDLAAQLSTDESPAFLNGVLGRALTTLRETYPAAARGSEPDAPADPADSDESASDLLDDEDDAAS